MSVRALTFDVVGTLIDFETGILGCVESVAPGLDPAAVLSAYAAAEDAQQASTPELALSPMLDPISERLAAELGDPFGDTVTVDDVGVNKPDPRMFHAALARLAEHRIGPAEVLHVAQSQYHDIGAAHRLGLATCWVEPDLAQISAHLPRG